MNALGLRNLAALVVLLLSTTLAFSQRAINASGGIPGKFLSDDIPPSRMEKYSDLAVGWMREYLRIDTTNPPGNELRAAMFFKRIFDAEKIENRVFEYRPGRANVWAILRKTMPSSKRPFILLNHMDVVTSDPDRWRASPFSGDVIDGLMYGRGAQDMKNEGIAQLVAMLMIKRERIALDRDIIFLGVADEEVDDSGTDWMIANRYDLLGNAEFLITEGGDNPEVAGDIRYVGVDVAEKSPLWLRVTATGPGGHGSRPMQNSAPNRLLRALNRIVSHQQPIKLTPAVEQFLREMAQFQPLERAALFQNISTAIQDRATRHAIANDESIAYMFQNTISVTMLSGSRQTNVIPAVASANLDVRLLPGEDPKAFIELLRRVVADPAVKIEPLRPGFAVANSSPINTELYDAIRSVSNRHFGAAPVIPKMTSGYTENQRYRRIGIVSYGFSSFATSADEAATEHNDNERVRVSELRRAPRVLFDLITQISTLEADTAESATTRGGR